MSFKKIIGKIHLILGLGSGLIVFIVAITGCMYAFHEEIQDFTKPYRLVVAENKPVLIPSELKKIAEKAKPGMKASRVIYPAGNRAAEVMVINKGEYFTIYLNPYSGQFLKAENLRQDFFTIILYLHISLLLPGEIGHNIVAYSTLTFVVMLITGIILWWPKNKNAVRQRFTIKWNAKWQRTNYDMHNVLGFYMTWIVLFIAFTGLVWAFEWVADGYYRVLSMGKPLIKYESPISDTTAIVTAGMISVADRAWQKAIQEEPGVLASAVFFPDEPKEVIMVYTNTVEGTYHKVDYRYFDQNTMKEYNVKHHRGRYKDATGADKIMRMNYDIHVGALLGLPGKFMAFFASLIAASLPVTGFMVWKGRKRSQKKKKVVKSKIGV